MIDIDEPVTNHETNTRHHRTSGVTVTISWHSIAMLLAGAVGVLIIWAVFQSVTADAATDAEETTFVPIEPCRLFDTRPSKQLGPHTTFGANDTTTIQAHGANGDCTIPTDAVGLSLNVTAMGATARTNVRVWPDGDQPRVSSLNPAPGQPPVPNAVTTGLSPTGSFNVFNKNGNLDVLVDVNGYYTRGLAQRVAALEELTAAISPGPNGLAERVAELEELTAAMSLETVDGHPVVRFTGVNVQVVNGLGSTAFPANGTGNLIVGYNEAQSDDERTGSHNVVVGYHHSYPSNGGLVAGYNNTISGPFSSVTGGRDNVAASSQATVSGGQGNTAGGAYSSVSGGGGNKATTLYASVSGGQGNTATGIGSSVSGGVRNVAEGGTSSVSGGDDNKAGGDSATVSGGESNTAQSDYSSVSGGENNWASGSGDHSSISGGKDNSTRAAHASISGGEGNTALGSASSVSGGYDNKTFGPGSSVSGGVNNEAYGDHSSIVGGDTNGIQFAGDFGVIVGGFGNEVDGPRAVVVGGDTNTASGSKSVVSGGEKRSVTGTHDWRAGSGSFETS